MTVKNLIEHLTGLDMPDAEVLAWDGQEYESVSGTIYVETTGSVLIETDLKASGTDNTPAFNAAISRRRTAG